MWVLLLGPFMAGAWAQTASAAEPPPCDRRATPACFVAFALPAGAGRMHYYTSRLPGAGQGPSPRSAIVVMHGHPRDANRSFDAALLAARRAGRLDDTLIAAPLFQVAEDRSARCRARGVPPPEAGDALWTCSSWLDGSPSQGAVPIGSFAALDALVAELVRQWPGLQTITLAGFSAGAQMLQHSVGFAGDPPAGVTLRYVIADPGSWLYFDPVRPVPTLAGNPVGWDACGGGADFPAGCTFRFDVPSDLGACRDYDGWKYGVEALPAALGRPAAEAKARYAKAQIAYLEGERDSSAEKGAFYPILDKSCAALLQGPYRLQRGQAYLAYEQAFIPSGDSRNGIDRGRRLTVVPGCGHDVTCVLPSEAARASLFPATPSPAPHSAK